MRPRPILLTTLALLLGASVARADPPAAKVEGGQLAGVLDGEAAVFKGVPYAAAPVGSLRWAPPQTPAGWMGLRDASQFGPICPQPKGARRLEASVQSEDCLTLNVWTPARRPVQPMPVMVWIHGGGFETGSGSDPLYDGKAFARDGVVLVTINYRLGLLGFFAHPSLTKAAGPKAPLANYGLMDQVAALSWVKRNISAFGGDPSNVTVFGESAGGAAIVTLLTTPTATGLFQKAIAESAGFWFGSPPLSKAEARGVQIAVASGAADGSLSSLRALPVAKLLGFPGDAQTIIDGRFLPRPPEEVLRSGHAIDVPLIVGTNSGEGSLLGDSDPSETLRSIPADELNALYADAPDDAARARIAFNDWGFAAPSRWLAAKEATGAPAWLYRFSYISRRGSAQLGAAHGSELIDVFESEAMWTALKLAPDMPDIQMAKTLHGCWVAFARTGRPDGCVTPSWSPYSPQTDNLIEFGEQIAQRVGFRKAQLDYQTDRIGLEKQP